MKFKITKETKAKSWRLIYFEVAVYAIIIVWALFYLYSFRWWFILGMTFWMVFLITGPGLCLYIEYMKYNEDCILDIEHRLFSYYGINGQFISIDFSDIERINVYIPPNNYRNRGAFSSMEVFSYARFELKNDREIYITCLMIPKLKLKDFINEYFSDIPVKFHRWWIFPSIRLCNYFRKKRK